MNDLIDTTEMYLKTIYELLEENIVPMRARITERLHQSGPTVSQTVARMERDGLLRLNDDRHIQLTAEGLARAEAVMRKHRLAERMLTDVIGLDWSRVHEEACRWEHVMSDEVEGHIARLLNNPDLSPYGTPIPGLERLADDSLEPDAYPDLAFLAGVDRLSAAVASRPDPAVAATFTVRRLGEAIQADPTVICLLDQLGLRPGQAITAHAGGIGIQIECGDQAGEVDEAVAASIFVDR